MVGLCLGARQPWRWSIKLCVMHAAFVERALGCHVVAPHTGIVGQLAVCVASCCMHIVFRCCQASCRV